MCIHNFWKKYQDIKYVGVNIWYICVQNEYRIVPIELKP